MNLLLITMGVLVAGILALLLWSTSKKASERGPVRDEIENLCLAGKHVINLPQIRQALEPADFEYLSGRSDAKMVRKIRKERRRIALKYLEGLREDFERLVDATQAVAALSPEVEAQEEWKRFRLSAEFRVKYRLVWAKFALGAPTFPGLEGIALMVSSLALDLERAVTKAAATAMRPGAPTSAQS
jgi:hypothetical protein